MNLVALLLCTISFVAMVGAGIHYKKTQRTARIKLAQAGQEQEKIYFWDMVQIPPMEVNGMVNQAMAVVTAYFRAPSIADKAATLSNGFAQIGKMNRYYADRPYEVLGREPEIKKIGMLKVHGADCLQIAVETKNKAIWEFSFYKGSDGIWKLDWPAFARYQEMDWSDFVHGQDDFPEGAEFRVWAMRDKTEEDPKHYAVRFIGPPANGRDRQGAITPPVLIEKKSDLGKEFYRYYRINELQNRGYRILSANDDPNYIRMRAVLSKEDVPGKARKEIKLKKIVSEGWYDNPPD